MIVLKAEVTFFNIENCLIINNLAAFGIFFATENDKYLIINLNHVDMYYNYGDTTAGLSSGQETNNRTIIWKNSKFKANLSRQMAIFMFIYIVLEIKVLRITMVNCEIKDNHSPDFNALFISWVLSDIPVYNFINCEIVNNSFYGIYPKNDISATINLCGFADGYIMNIEETKFDSNYFYNTFIIVFYVQVYIKNVNFYNNTCVLTSILFFDTSYFETKNTIFEENNIVKSDFIYFNQLSIGNFANITFIRNSVNDWFIASLKLNFLSFFNITFVEISTKSSSGMFFLKQSYVNLMQNITFYQVLYASYLFYGESTTLNISKFNVTECNFDHLFFFFKEGIIIMNQSIIISTRTTEEYNCFFIQNSYFYMFNVIFQDQDFNYLTFIKLTSIKSNISLQDCQIRNMIFDRNKAFLYISNSILYIDRTLSENSNNIISSSKSSIYITLSIFSNFTCNLTQSDPFFSFIDSSTVLIFDSFFLNLIQSASIMAFTGSKLNETVNIFNCSFLESACKNCMGGAISISKAKININGSTFYQIKAIHGGAIYMHCEIEDFEFCGFNLTYNNFIANQAEKGGGAFKWQMKKPFYSNNIFLNNTAKYGEKYASFFCRMGLQVMDEYPTQMTSDTFSHNASALIFLYNVSTGRILSETPRIYPLDSYNQIILEKLNSTIQIQLLENNTDFIKDLHIDAFEDNLVINDPFYYNTQESNKSIIYGDIILAQTADLYYESKFLTVISPPTSLIYIKFTSDNLTKYPKELYNGIKSSNEIVALQDYYIMLPIYIKQCETGEIYDFIQKICIQCPIGYFSLEPKSNTCYLCQDHASCKGYDLIELDLNYWRINNSSLNYYLCNPYIENCFGGVDSLCDDSYTGILCQSCKNKQLNRNFIGKCKECLDPLVEILKNIFLYIILLLVLNLLVYVFVADKFNKFLKFGVKMFIIYFHYLIANFSIQLDLAYNPFKNYFYIMYIMTKLNFWISLDCVSFGYYYKLFENFLLMILVYITFLIVYVVFKLKFNRMKAMKAVTVLYYIIKSLLFSFLVSNFSCRNVEGEFYLAEDTNIICSGALFYKWMGFYLVNIIIFGFIIPVMILRKAIISDYDKFNKILHVFTLGYKKKFCYFDIILYFRNMVIIIVNLHDIDTNIKICINLFILLYSLFLEFRFDIYECKKHKVLPNLIQIIFILNNYLIISTLNDSHKTYSQSIIFPIIVAIHLCFLGALARHIYKYTRMSNRVCSRKISKCAKRLIWHPNNIIMI